MQQDKYHLRAGDLLVNSENGVFGIIVKKTRHYFYFYINYKPEEVKNGAYMREERASRQRVYESIDNRLIKVYYGTSKGRRKRIGFQEEGNS